MDFDIQVQQVTMYTCADGTQFSCITSAQEHNEALKSAAEGKALKEDLTHVVDMYLNSNPNFTQRKRSQVAKSATEFYKWFQTWDKEYIDYPVVPQYLSEVGKTEEGVVAPVISEEPVISYEEEVVCSEEEDTLPF